MYILYSSTSTCKGTHSYILECPHRGQREALLSRHGGLESEHSKDWGGDRNAGESDQNERKDEAKEREKRLAGDKQDVNRVNIMQSEEKDTSNCKQRTFTQKQGLEKRYV